MRKNKTHLWWVDTGLYRKQIGCRTETMEDARLRAYEKLTQMSYEDFCKHVSLNVSGAKRKETV